MLERWHGVLKTVLTKAGNYKEWDKFIPLTLFTCRDAPHAATGLSPFEVMFGHNICGPTSILKELWSTPKNTPTSVVQYLQALRERTQLTAETVREMNGRAKQRAKLYDKSAIDDPLEEGDEVLVLHPAGPRGLSAQWMGPYLVEEAISSVSYRIGTPGKKGAILHRNHLKRFVQSHHVNIVLLADGNIEDGDHLDLTLPVDPLTEEKTTFKIGQDLSKEKTDQLLQLLEKYQSIFSEKPGTTDKLIFDIQTGDHQPAKVRPYRIPTRWKDKLKTDRPTAKPWDNQTKYQPVECYSGMCS